MKFSVKLIAYFLIIGIVSVTSLGIISYSASKNALVNRTYEQLTSIRTIKENQIEKYFAERFGDIKVYASNSAIQAATQRFINAFNEGGLNGEEYKQWENAHGAKLEYYINEYGYYDLFFISPNGDVVYTAAKEGDLGQNVFKGKLANSPLTKAFNSGKNDFSLTDFEHYDVSNEPASFISGPVNDDNGNFVGVIAYQLSLEAINEIMQETAGLGESGESYLVGDDLLLRSDSRFSNETTVLKQRVDTEGVKAGLSGQRGTKIIEDYRGIPVLSSYANLEIEGLKWTILAEIDEAEVMIPVHKMRNIIAIVALVLLVVIIVVSLMIRKEIRTSLGEEPDEIARIAENIATGNLNIEFKNKAQMVGVYKSMQDMASKLKDIVSNVMVGTGNIARASEEMSSTSQQMSQGANEQASSVEEVSSTMEEITANIQQNTDNSKETEKISSSAVTDINQVSERAKVAVEANNVIGEKIQVINDIAFQTNILALNAAVEAARAGEHGKGFAVVAAEVRKLAENSKIAAEEIVGIVKNSIDANNEAGELLVQTLPNIEKTAQLVQEISAASMEQSNGATQVNSAIQQVNSVTQQNAAAAEELASSSEEMASQADQLNDLISFFKLDNNNSSTATSKLKSFSAAKIKPSNGDQPKADTAKSNGNSQGFQVKLDRADKLDNEFTSY